MRLMHYRNASPKFLCTDITWESRKIEDSDSVGLGCISNIPSDVVATGPRPHYTREGTASDLAVVKCIPFQCPFSLSKTKSSYKIIL